MLTFMVDADTEHDAGIPDDWQALYNHAVFVGDIAERRRLVAMILD